MSRIQEIVNLGSENDNLLSVILSTLNELDWIVVESGKDSVSFKEKRRFDHFNRVEGTIDLGFDRNDGNVKLIMSNEGFGSIQDDYLRGKASEFVLLLKDNLWLENETEGRSLNGKKKTISEEIEGLAQLHQQGELSDDEFRRAKERLLRK